MKFLDATTAAVRFRREVRPLLAISDRTRIKQLFASLTAAVAMEEGEAAFEDMAEELQDALLSTTQYVRRGIFDDL